MIIFGSVNSGLWRVPAAGGTPVALTTLDASRKERQHELPSFLPDGRHFLYLRVGDRSGDGAIYVGSLDDPPDGQSKKRLLESGFGAAFVPSTLGRPGKLLFMRGGTLMAQAFDASTQELKGNPQPVVERIGSIFQTGFFSASPATLVYRGSPPTHQSQITWVDAQGRLGEKVGNPGPIAEIRLSPDGTRAAYRMDANGEGADIWLLDLTRGVSSRFTFGPHVSWFPVWAPDGREIVFSRNWVGVYNLYWKPANGARDEEPLLRTKLDGRPHSWSRDGRFLFYTASTEPSCSSEDIWVLPMQGDRTPVPLLSSRFDESVPELSPDGRWLAYHSDESGSYEVYVREFLATPGSITLGAKWLVSKDGGANRHWRADGKQLLFTSKRLVPGNLMSVSVDTSRSFTAGTPHELFSPPALLRYAAFTGDFKRFLFPVPIEEKTTESFTVMINWTSTLDH